MSKYRDNPEAFKEGQKHRPEFCTNDHLEYLDELRESGECNMFGARPYLMNAFDDLSEADASAVLGYWMNTFGEATR